MNEALVRPCCSSLSFKLAVLSLRQMCCNIGMDNATDFAFVKHEPCEEADKPRVSGESGNAAGSNLGAEIGFGRDPSLCMACPAKKKKGFAQCERHKKAYDTLYRNKFPREWDETQAVSPPQQAFRMIFGDRGRGGNQVMSSSVLLQIADTCPSVGQGRLRFGCLC